MPFRRRMPSRALAAAALIFLAPALRAQVVRGEVVADAAGGAVASAVVQLVDAQGRRVAAVLTDDRGSFALRAPAAGRYSVRAERVGFRGVTGAPFDLADGQTLQQRLVAPSAPVTLAGVTITGNSSCDVRPAEGVAAAQLWEEARKALDATAVAQDQRLFRLTMVQYERTLPPDGGQVRQERSWRASGVSDNPFVSAPAESLAKFGYARHLNDSTTYYAPDARVLLSDSFSDRHCLRARAGDNEHPGLVGLAFEPARRGKHTDVHGVLWLDRQSAELRYLEFEYTPLPVRVADGLIGGRVEFRKLPTGAWIVERWALRAPIFARSERDPGDLAAQVSSLRLASIREFGGEVAETFSMDGRQLSETQVATVSGTVYDSLNARPLTGASVFLVGTDYRTRTDSTGAFHLGGLPEGRFLITFTHPVLATLGFAAPQLPLELERGAQLEQRFAIPTMAGILQAQCPAEVRGREGALLAGVVRDAATGAPVVGATLALTWRALKVAGHNVSMTRSSAEAETDSTGVYRICGVPMGKEIGVDVTAGGRTLAHTAARLTDSLTVIDLRTAGAAAPSAVLVARVTGPDGAPLAGAAVTVVGTDAQGIADSSGTARLRQLPGGTQSIEVHLVGYEAVRQNVELAPKDEVRVAIRLEKAAQVLSTVTVRGAPALPDFENRRRHGNGVFLTEEQIRRRQPSKVADILRSVPGVAVYASSQFGGEPTIQFQRAVAGWHTELVRPDSLATDRTTDPNTGKGVGQDGLGVVRNTDEQGGTQKCPPAWYIDGHHEIGTLQEIEGMVRPEDIVAMELYRSPAEVPPQFVGPDTRCGVIVIWTRQALRRAASKTGGQ